MKKQTTTKGFAILSTAGIINKILALIYIPIQAYIMKDYGNGIVGAGYTIYIFIFYLSNAGIPSILSKLISEQMVLHHYKNCQKIFKIAGISLVLFGMISSIMMALGAHWISRQISQPEAYLMILALSPAFMFTAVSSAFRGYFQGKSNMIPTAVSQILEQATNSILTIVFAALFIKYGVAKAAAGTTIGTSFGALSAAVYLFFTYLKNRKNLYWESTAYGEDSCTFTSKYILKTISIFSMPAILSTIAMNTYGLLDLKLGVSRLLAGGLSAHAATELYGVFTTQYQKTMNIPLTFTASLPMALIPAVSAAIAMADKKLLERKITEAFRFIFIILIPSAMGLAVLSKPIITLIFFSTSLNRGSDLLMLGSWTIILFAVVSVQSAILIGIGKPFISPINLIAGLVIKAYLNYTLISIPNMNMKGAIISSFISFSIVCLLNYFMIMRFVKIPFRLIKLSVKPIIASIIMSIFVYGNYVLSNSILVGFISSNLVRNDICTLFSIALGAILYIIIMIKFKAISVFDISKLPAGYRINSLFFRLHLLNNTIIKRNSL